MELTITFSLYFRGLLDVHCWPLCTRCRLHRLVQTLHRKRGQSEMRRTLQQGNCRSTYYMLCTFDRIPQETTPIEKCLIFLHDFGIENCLSLGRCRVRCVITRNTAQQHAVGRPVRQGGLALVCQVRPRLRRFCESAKVSVPKMFVFVILPTTWYIHCMLIWFICNRIS